MADSDMSKVEIPENIEGTLYLDSHPSEFEKFLEQLKKNERMVIGMKRGKNAVTLKRAYPKVGRNDACPCGSGKKYKNCHMREVERKYVVVS